MAPSNRRLPALRRLGVPVLGVALASVALRVASAAPSAQIVTFDPTPAQPSSGDECTITIDGGASTTQVSRDVALVKAKLEEALAGSEDMRLKTAEACAKHRREILIVVVRDSPIAKGANSRPDLHTITVDVGDLAAIGEFATGSDSAKRKLADTMLTRSLAHEMDHLRDTADEVQHKDPPADANDTGPAVDDENLVARELGHDTDRMNYGRMVIRPGTGAVSHTQLIDFVIDGEPIVVDATRWGHRDRTTTRPPATPPAPRQTPRSRIDAVPGGSCRRGFAPCWEPADATDADLDGVHDAEDTCPGFPDFQQLDLDGDGLGAACDPDDDGDGVARGLEVALGSTDGDADALPEHADVEGTCDDGEDNDADGLSDLDDPSCTRNGERIDELPRRAAPEEPLPARVDRSRGGVPDGTDAHVVDATMILDGEAIELSGLVALDWSDPVETDDGVVMPLDLRGLELRGVSESRGPVTVAVAPSWPRPTGLVVAGSGAEELPADASVPVVLSLTDLEGITSSAGAPLDLVGRITGWPLWGETLASEGEGAPLLRGDDVVATIDALSLTVRAPGGGGSGHTDPVGDVDTIEGDPSIDVVASTPFTMEGCPWVRVETDGAWPPPDVYSWFCTVALLGPGDEEIASATTQRHDGVADTTATGVDPSLVEVQVEARGFRVLLGAPLDPAGYGMSCGMLRTQSSTYVFDDAGPYPFDADEAPFAE